MKSLVFRGCCWFYGGYPKALISSEFFNSSLDKSLDLLSLRFFLDAGRVSLEISRPISSKMSIC